MIASPIMAGASIFAAPLAWAALTSHDDSAQCRHHYRYNCSSDSTMSCLPKLGALAMIDTVCSSMQTLAIWSVLRRAPPNMCSSISKSSAKIVHHDGNAATCTTAQEAGTSRAVIIVTVGFAFGGSLRSELYASGDCHAHRHVSQTRLCGDGINGWDCQVLEAHGCCE